MLLGVASDRRANSLITTTAQTQSLKNGQQRDERSRGLFRHHRASRVSGRLCQPLLNIGSHKLHLFLDTVLCLAQGPPVAPSDHACL